jgi:hypothetical protein
MQMLGMVPPAFWCEQWDTTPEDLLSFTHNGDWKAIFFNGWRHAIQRHSDTTWAWIWITSHPIMSEQMIILLPPEQAEEAICTRLRANELERTALLLEHYPHPWSIELSRAVLDTMRRHLTSKKENRKVYWQLQQMFSLLPYRMPAEMAEEAARAWAKAEGESWMMHENYLQEPLAILQFRYEMLEALKEANQ